MEIEAGVVALLGALTVSAMVVAWQLAVRPDLMLGMWGEPERGGWFDHHPGALRGLRLALGVVVFLMGFLTGLCLTFLTGTAS